MGRKIKNVRLPRIRLTGNFSIESIVYQEKIAT